MYKLTSIITEYLIITSVALYYTIITFFNYAIFPLYQAYQEDLEADLLLIEENVEREMQNMAEKVRKKSHIVL